MKKSELLENVLSILDNHKVKNEELRKELSKLIGPKVGGRNILDGFPNVLDKEGNIKEKYCLWYKEYKSIDNFKKVSKSKDGYHYECKDAEKQWHYYGKLIKEKSEELSKILNKILDSEISPQEGKELKLNIDKEIEELKEKRNNKVMIEIPSK